MRRALLWASITSSAVALAQPADPYAPRSEPAPVPVTAGIDNEAVLAEQIAQSLVARAQELYDARVFVDAKQLAMEALARAPLGAAGQHARYLVREANKELGVADRPLPGDPIRVKITAVEEEAQPASAALPPEPEKPRPPTRLVSRVHGALYVGLIGATVGSFLSDDSPVGGAVPVGLAGVLGGALLAPLVEEKLGWSESQMRTVGSGSMWGGVVGGLFGDAVKKQDTTARQVLVASSIGATTGALIGAGIASTDRFTRGDVALVDTLAGIGTVGGLTLGMLMQPAETEAYSVNAIIGATAGFVTGAIAGPLTNTTERRMIRVAAAAAIGGAAPFLLYGALYDDSETGDERLTGFLSSTGLVVGAYIGFRMTRGMDDGKDLKSKPRGHDDPLAAVHRHADGQWALGRLGIQPLSRALAPQPGATVPLVSATW